jgi:multiple antibiotic resistance protein
MDTESLRALSEAAIGIFAIVNPIGGLPTFIALTEDSTTQERRQMFRLAGVTALAIICVMALFGQFLLSGVFQIEIHEFAFAGGLMLVIIGVRQLIERPNSRRKTLVDDAQRKIEQTGLAVSPIASPLLVGPGCIVNVMLLVNQHGRPFALGAALLAFVVVILVLNYAHVIYRLMGHIGALAVGRVMQIFIVAIGVKFCFGALAKFFSTIPR